MSPPRDTHMDTAQPGASRDNPTWLAMGAGLLALVAILLACFAMTEEKRQDRAVDQTAQAVGKAASDVDKAATRFVDGLKK